MERLDKLIGSLREINNRRPKCSACGLNPRRDHDGWCKQCRAAYLRARRLLGVDAFYNKQQDTSKRKTFKAKVLAHMGGKCARCGFTPTGPEQFAAIHVHHPLRDRPWTIATAATRAWSVIAKELERCELLCANCHTIEHHNEERAHPGRPRSPITPRVQYFLDRLREKGLA